MSIALRSAEHLAEIQRIRDSHERKIKALNSIPPEEHERVINGAAFLAARIAQVMRKERGETTNHERK